MKAESGGFFMEFLGVAAAVLTTGSFIPQVIKVIRTKDVSAISLWTYLFFCAGTICWTIYGIYIHSWSLIIANGLTTILAGIILMYKIRYDKKS
jgi:MtN3 and saliva related transmembrane protein